MSTYRILLGDCREVLAAMDGESVDAIVTDPPYGLAFMGKRWDYDVPSVELWAECLRVLKPGGHLLAFAGTRTQHRMAVRIEDAGFEIRDMIAWVYGSGFPKSLDVSKAIDKAAGAERTEIVGYAITAPATEAARRWQGWGTALKPALEPITVARKPLIGTVAANVLAHGTGALNIDSCRVAGAKPVTTRGAGGQHGRYSPIGAQGRIEDDNAGRFPPNLLLSHHPDCRRVGERKVRSGGDPTAPRGRRGNGFADIGAPSGDPRPNGPTYGTETVPAYACAPGCPVAALDGQSAGSSRFFPQLDFAPEYDVPFLYQAKAGTRERNAGLDHLPKKLASVGNHDAAGRDPTNPNNYRAGSMRRRVEAGLPATEPRANVHPTVKPIELMRWLVRLVTPAGGVVLDPFAGSGTTGIAAVIEGCEFVGIEREAEYAEIAERRIKHWLATKPLDLFNEDAA